MRITLRTTRAVLVATALGVAATIVVATEPAAARGRTYLIGDSVAAWSSSVLQRHLAPFSVTIDAAACRGTTWSCAVPGQQAAPTSGLTTVQRKRGTLGKLVVIELGYNDSPQRSAIDRLMLELRAQGVQHVAWINLHEQRSSYRKTNDALAAAAKRWPELRVLDWRTASAGRAQWFTDGVHLTESGKAAFGSFLARELSRFR